MKYKLNLVEKVKMLINIERRICLHPMYLDQNIMSHLLSEVKKSMEGECTRDFGHILNVTRIVDVKNNCISAATSDIVFTVVFEANILKPEEGRNLTGTVCLLIPTGILLNVQDKLNILVPRATLNGYEFNQGKYEKEGMVIKNNDVLIVNITGVQYSKKKFSCIGRLVEN